MNVTQPTWWAGLKEPSPLALTSGTCSACGCTVQDACINNDGIPCGWQPHTKETRCTFCPVGMPPIFVIITAGRKAETMPWIEASPELMVLHRAVRVATGDWRRAAIRKRIEQLEKKQSEDGS